MKDDHKTKKQLVHKLTESRSQNAAPKKSKTRSISAELAAKEAILYAESIVETIREPLLVLDADMKIISANRNFYRTFKVNPGETIGSFIYDLGNKQWDIPKLRELLEEVLPKHKAFYDFEVAHNFQDIGHKIMLLNARQVYRKDIGTKTILLAIEDITEHKRLEDLLKEAEGRYRHVFETASDGIVLFEKREGKITHANQAIEKMLGYPLEESVGKKLQDIGIVDIDDFQTLMQILDESGITNYTDVTLKTKSGQHIDTDIYLADRAKLVQCNIRDISLRKRADKILRESEERYSALFDRSLDLVYITDFEGRFIDANAAALNRLGYTREEIHTLNFTSLLSEDQLPLAFKTMQEMRETGVQMGLLELRLRHKNGSDVYVETKGSTIISNGIPVAIQAIARDITERKRAEDVLRESEEQYRNLFENANEAIFVAQDRKLVFFNPMTTALVGYSAEEIASWSSAEFLHPDDRDMVFDRHNRRMKGEDIPSRYSLRIIRGDGSVKWVELNAIFISWKGKPATLNFMNDITDRKQAADVLKENEKKYRLLADNVNDVIFALDMNLNYTYVSPSVKILRGYDPEEIMKQPSFETLTPSSWDLAMKTLSEVMELEKSEHKEINISRTLQLEMKRKDGTTVWTEVKFSFIRDENQRMVGILGVTRDITKRKQTEDELKQSEEKYRSIFENTQEGIFRTTPEGKIIISNQALANMLGYESPEELMTSITDLARQLYVNPEDRRKLQEMIKEHGFIKEYEIPYYKKDRSIIWGSLNMHAVHDENGQIIHWDGIAENITDRKQAAEELLRTLESLRKAVGATIQVMVSAVEARDPYTAGHQLRSADLARAIATEMGLPQEKIEGVRMAGSIHDIGKLSIPAEILSKPTKLTNLEFSLIKEHSRSGYEMLKDVESPWPLAQIVYQHHERMNGSGYPRNLKGDEILMEARIMAVADVVEAMASHRPYRPALGIDAALGEIEKNKGILYDNAVADACLRLFRKKGYQLKKA